MHSAHHRADAARAVILAHEQQEEQEKGTDPGIDTDEEKEEGSDLEEEKEEDRATWKSRGRSARSNCTLLAEFTLHPDYAAVFPRVLSRWLRSQDPGLRAEFEDKTEIDVHTAVRIKTLHMGDYEDSQLLRVAPNFKGRKWQDGVQVLFFNADAGQRRRNHARLGPGGLFTMPYEPDYHRKFCIVHLVFTFPQSSRLWLFIEPLEGAHSNRKSSATWESTIIPNWPHLQTATRTTRHQGRQPRALADRMEIIPYEHVESVRLITLDVHQPADLILLPPSANAKLEFWCPMDVDCVPHDEHYNPDSTFTDDPHFQSMLVADALSKQPWELVPPSQAAQRDRQVANEARGLAAAQMHDGSDNQHRQIHDDDDDDMAHARRAFDVANEDAEAAYENPDSEVDEEEEFRNRVAEMML
jgi:hypothetical protein